MNVAYFISRAALLVPIAIYMYFLVRRVVSIFKPNLTKIKRRIICWLIASIIIAPAVTYFSPGLLLLMHFEFICGVVDIGKIILKRFFHIDSITLHRIYASCLVPIVISSAVVGYGYINIHRVIKTEYTVTSEKEIRDDGYKIAFLTDVHFGTTMDKEDLKKYCNRISKQNPDFVVLGGDIVDENTSNTQMKNCFETLGGIKNKNGIYYVYGNHDNAHYTTNPTFTANELTSTIEANGIKVLADKVVKINDDIVLTGRNDRSDRTSVGKKRKAVTKLISADNKDLYNIIIDHQPLEEKENSNLGFDMMLSGHTHDGQIWPAGLLLNIFEPNSTIYGMDKKGDMTVITSSGIGGWGFAVRTQSHCEYVIINLTNK